MQENRQVLFSLIRQNYKTIRSLVKENSDEDKFKENIKLVNRAINDSFFSQNGIDEVKDFRYLMDEISMFKFFVMQNDAISQMLMDKKNNLKGFFRDCKDMVDNFRYDRAFCKYNGLIFEYHKLVPQKYCFSHQANGAPRLKELTKAEYDSIDEMEKVDTLVSVTLDSYARYKKRYDTRMPLYSFASDLNYGEYRKGVLDIIDCLVREEKNKESELSSLIAIPEPKKRVRKKKEKHHEQVIQNAEGYYFGEESDQGYLFYDEKPLGE